MSENYHGEEPLNDSEAQAQNQNSSGQQEQSYLYQNQSYPNQPYPNQPYPNQPYPNQPYPNQPYPNQPFPSSSRQNAGNYRQSTGGQNDAQGVPPYVNSSCVQTAYGQPGSPMPQNAGPDESGTKKKKGIRGSFIGGFLTCLILCLVMTFVGVLMANRITEGSGTSSLSSLSSLTTEALTEEQAQELVSKVDKLVRYINEFYIEDVDLDTLLDGAYHGIVDALGDKYASYYNEEEMADFTASSNGNYVGIGVTVMLSDTGVAGAEVVSVNQNGSAYEMGIQPGDVLVKADDTELGSLSLNEMVSHIRGEEGSMVSITYYRDGQEYTVELERRTLSETAVYYTMLDNNIGYISLTEFTKVAVDQYQEALDSLQQQGMEGLILDLRDDGGGLVDVCVSIADDMIDTGLVTYMEDKNGDRTEFKATESGELDMPIVILINGNTASASELLTLCMLDYGKAVTVGTTSYGKGIAQTTYSLRDGTAIKFTTDKYYSPNGTNIHGTGITPDYEVELPDDVVLARIKTNGIPDLTQDTQLQKAIEVMTQELN